MSLANALFPEAQAGAREHERAVARVMVRTGLRRPRAVAMLRAFTTSTVMTVSQATDQIMQVIDSGAWPIEYRPLGMTAGLLQAMHRVDGAPE